MTLGMNGGVVIMLRGHDECGFALYSVLSFVIAIILPLPFVGTKLMDLGG